LMDRAARARRDPIRARGFHSPNELPVRVEASVQDQSTCCNK
jgi:hypothetical protein